MQTKLKQILPEATGEQIEAISAILSEAAAESERSAKAAKDELEHFKFETALNRALEKSGAKNAKALKALLNLEGAVLDGDEIIGINSQIEEVRAQNPYLFFTSDENVPKFTSAAASETKESFEKMSYLKRVELFNQNPKLYEKLKTEI